MFCSGLVRTLIAGSVLVSLAAAQVPTTLNDFRMPGTQPDESGGVDFYPVLHSGNCQPCHEIYDPVEVPVYTRWAGSMMGNAMRDPLFTACLAVANQDAAFAGDLCLRCHAPGGWLGGRSLPTDGSGLIQDDYDGINCNFCHRMVDPEFKPGISPAEDTPILDALSLAGLLPVSGGNGNYVVDYDDHRRGPFNDVPLNLHGVDILHSPFHSTSEMCATCHDVSNPVFSRQPDGSYVPNPLNAPHPTEDKYDMFPVERTYSEWLNSTYATVGVDHGGVFGGNHPTGIMRTCQDCHMPDTEAYGCAFDFDPFFVRPNVPSHDFNGGNAWIPDVLGNLYAGELNIQYLHDSKDRAIYMLQNACTLDVTPSDCSINVRVTNETGHKLPSGYPEGRRMWVTVEFYDDELSLVAVRGEYDGLTAVLTTSDTKVYEAELGMDATMSGITGHPVGPSFHFAINNKYYKDNRIPPRGFTNAAFDSIGASPVGATYADGQFWDDTLYRIPEAATSAKVTVWYQTASKEYVEFLRDANVTNSAGDLLHAQWLATGMSPPVKMRETTISTLVAGMFGDADCDSDVDLVDYELLSDCVAGPDTAMQLGCDALDGDNDSAVDLGDFLMFQTAFTGGF